MQLLLAHPGEANVGQQLARRDAEVGAKPFLQAANTDCRDLGYVTGSSGTGGGLAHLVHNAFDDWRPQCRCPSAALRHRGKYECGCDCSAKLFMNEGMLF